MTLLRGHRAPAPRTLVEVLLETIDRHPDAPAVDNGADVLTYREFGDAAEEVAAALDALGVGRGDRVGVRISSGSVELYVAIMGILLAGAAYVPADADDPDERARVVFDEADVAAVIGEAMTITTRVGRAAGHAEAELPSPADDAWVIFTSGSTGTPKGVAVSHRSAAAFVDAEAEMFLQERPLRPGDRVMAGLSVAFDASCEEMWLAWRYGACLVPAPRSLVRSGMDLGPWLIANDITVVSTVPTLVMLWPLEALRDVRLLILGGEACPPDLGSRLATPTREVWNTYGPTEATVVSCGARLTGDLPVRIGLPLDGWDLAVVDAEGVPVGPGGTGELIIGGVGLARYLDPEQDALKYAPMPSLGWSRAYRSGDLVRHEEEGLVFVGRADDQVKIGGRRIELGEIDNRLLDLPGVQGAAAAVRTTASGNQLLVGYVAVDDAFDATSAAELLRRELPASMVPRLARVDELPTKTSGKVDRDALPWPLPGVAAAPRGAVLGGTAGWLQELWGEILGAAAGSGSDDFFELGGGSLTAAQLVGRLRTRFPETTVADVYEHPTIVGLAAALDDMAVPSSRTNRRVRPVPLKTQVGQIAFTVPLRTLTGLRWLTWTAAANNVAAAVLGVDWLPVVAWVLGGARLVPPGLSGRPDGRGRGRCPDPAPGSPPGGLSPRRQGAPAAVARRAARRRDGRRPPRRCGVGASLRTRPRCDRGTPRRPALDPAGHRPADAGGPVLDRAGGRPAGALAGRRRAAHRPGRHRRRRACRRPQHAVSRRAGRQGRGDRAGGGGLRSSAGGGGLVGGAGRARRGCPRAVGGAATEPPRVDRGVRRRRRRCGHPAAHRAAGRAAGGGPGGAGRHLPRRRGDVGPRRTRAGGPRSPPWSWFCWSG